MSKPIKVALAGAGAFGTKHVEAMRLIDGGDHALSDFDDHLPDLLHFLQLS